MRECSGPTATWEEFESKCGVRQRLGDHFYGNAPKDSKDGRLSAVQPDPIFATAERLRSWRRDRGVRPLLQFVKAQFFLLSRRKQELLRQNNRSFSYHVSTSSVLTNLTKLGFRHQPRLFHIWLQAGFFHAQHYSSLAWENIFIANAHCDLAGFFGRGTPISVDSSLPLQSRSKFLHFWKHLSADHGQ